MDNNQNSLPKLVELSDSWYLDNSQSEYCEACQLLRNKTCNNDSCQGDKSTKSSFPKHSCISKFFDSEFHNGASACGEAWDDVEHKHTFWDKPGRLRRSVSCDCVLCREKLHDDAHNKQLMLHHNYSEDNIHSKVGIHVLNVLTNLFNAL